MAKIKITVDGPLMDGHKVTFKAPCDCVSVEKLKVCYVENGTLKDRLFTMKDSHGNDLTGLGNLFSKGAYVNVVLDTNYGNAYLQNANTNSYIEGMLRASNGVPFRFGVTENGEYGYIVTDEEGADTVHPFKNLVRDTPANALADTITEGFCAWVNGELIWGTRPAPINSQTGTIGIGYMSQDSQTTIVEFEKPFDAIPTVTVSVYIEKDDGRYTGNTIYNVTERGFTITFHGMGGGGKGVNGSCTWYAVV